MPSISSVQARTAIMAMLLLLGTAVTSADVPTPEHRELSKETREQMAVLHEQMAACLRTDKPFPECHSAMIRSCQEQLGEGCPMMMGMGHGSDTRHRMQPMAKPAG